jgi:hypothetical protein
VRDREGYHEKGKGKKRSDSLEGKKLKTEEREKHAVTRRYPNITIPRVPSP